MTHLNILTPEKVSQTFPLTIPGTLKSHPIPTLNWLPSAEKYPFIRSEHGETFQWNRSIWNNSRLSLYFLFTGKAGLGAGVGGVWVDGCWEHVGLSCAPGEMSARETSSWEQQIEAPVLQTGTALRHDASPRHQKCSDRLLGGRERQRRTESCIATFHRKGPRDAL